MAEVAKITAPAAAEAPKVEEVVAVPVAEKPTAVATTAVVVEKETPPAPEPEAEKPAVEEVEAEKPAEVTAEEEKVGESTSFKEESNVVGELPDPQKKALDELKLLIQEALSKHEFTAPPPPPPTKEEEKPAEEEAKPEEPTPETPAVEAPATAAVEETPKPEVPAPAAVEPKAEEKPTPAPAPAAEKPKAAEPVVAAPAPVVEAPKAAAQPPKPEPKVEAPAPAPVGAVAKVVAAVTEKVTAVTAAVTEKVTSTVDEDGAKTVEAIKETIVEVSAPAPEVAAPIEEAAPAEETPAVPPPPPEEVSIWGIPLLADEKTDVVLLKFLRARDFKVKDAFAMIKNTARWQKEFGTEALLEEDLGSELEKVVFTHGVDKEGHPVCYNVYGEFQNKELYQNTFGDEEKRQKFLRWRIQFLEKSIRTLDFSPDGVSTIVQVNDLKNSPLFRKELRQSTNQALQLLQDNYPEFVAKQVFINVPWYQLAFYTVISPFLTQRSKSKFVFAGPSRTAETLFKYIAPEQVPVQYGGLSREGEQEFTTADPVTEDIIKPATKHTIEFPVTEKSLLVWEVRVVGWDVTYGAEFTPSAEDGYTVIVQKSRKISPADETIITNSFKIGEPGKVVLTFDNQTSKKKKLLLRSKTKPSE